MKIKGPTKQPWRCNVREQEASSTVTGEFSPAHGGLVKMQIALDDGRSAEITMGPIEAELVSFRLATVAADIRKHRSENDYWRNR